MSIQELEQYYSEVQDLVVAALSRSAEILQTMQTRELKDLGTVNIRAEAAKIHHLVHQLCYAHSDVFYGKLRGLFAQGVNIYVDRAAELLPGLLQGEDARQQLAAAVEIFDKFKLYIRIMSFYFKDLIKRKFQFGKNPTLEEVRETVFVDATREYYNRVFQKMKLGDICKSSVKSILLEHLKDSVEQSKELCVSPSLQRKNSISLSTSSYTSDWDLLKGVVNMFWVFGNIHGFEIFGSFKAMLEDTTSSFYLHAAKHWIQTGKSLTNFVIAAHDLLEYESSRSQLYLNADCCKSLQTHFINSFVAANQSHYFNEPSNAFLELLQAYDSWYHQTDAAHVHQNLITDDNGRDGVHEPCVAWVLRRCYHLLSLVEKNPLTPKSTSVGLQPIAAALKQHLVQVYNRNHHSRSTELAEAEEKKNNKGCLTARDNHLQSLNSIHKQYGLLIEHCFQSDTSCTVTLKEQTQVAVNMRLGKYKLPVLLSQYFDNKMSSKSITEAEVESDSLLVINLFVFLVDKDLFLEHLHRQLANRLLSGVSDPLLCSWKFDVEQGLIQKLNHLPGVNDIVRKLYTMCRNVTLGSDLNDEWKKSSSVESIGFACEVKVFDLKVLPSYGDAGNVLLPEDFGRALQRFSLFYHHKFEGRKLTWLHPVSTVQIRAKYNNVKTIDMTLFQAIVLFAFNEPLSEASDAPSVVLSVNDLVERTQLSSEETADILHVLCGGIKIKQGGKAVVSPALLAKATDTGYSVNRQFSCSLVKWTMPSKVSQRVVPTAQVLEDDVKQQRKHAIDACIVRIMKQRRVMEYQQMIAEVLAQLSSRFSAEIKVVKQRIDDLIEREFLERDPQNPTVMKYLA